LLIVALTADATLATREWCLEAGMDAVITKPVEPVALLTAIEDMMANHDGMTTVGEVIPIVPEPTMSSTKHLRLVSTQVLDASALENLWALEEGERFFAEVVDEFYADGEDLLSDIETAVNNDDHAAIRRAVHALRSSAAHVGAHRVRAKGKEFHELLPAEVRAEGPRLLAELQDEFAVARAELDREVEQRYAAQ